MSQSNLTINHENGTELSVAIIDKTRWRLTFDPVGSYNPQDKKSMKALKIIAKFSKPELTLMDYVVDKIKPDNTVNIIRSNIPKPKQQTIANAIRSWQKKNLIKRISQEHYLINPYFFVPRLDNQEKVLSEWEQLL